MIQKLKNKTPFNQILILLVIGIVSIVILSIITTTLLAYIYPEMTTLSAQSQMQKFPVQYMIGSFLPFQFGLFLIPSLLYYRNKNSLEKKHKLIINIKTLLWSFFLFFILFCLLPFLTEINSFVLNRFDVLESIEYDAIHYKNSLNYLIGANASIESYWIALTIIGLIVPICEELFFRGFILEHIARNRNNNWTGVLISSFVFTLLHLNWYQFLPILCFGIALGIIYILTKSILPGIVLHALNNSLNVIWVRHDNMPHFLEHYAPILSGCLIIALIVILAIYHKKLKLH